MFEPRTIGIVGAGTIGRDTAYWLASASKSTTTVVLVDINPDALDNARLHIETLVGKAIKSGKMSDDVGRSVMARMQYTNRIHLLSGAQLVIEAATENITGKRAIMAELAGVVSADCLICTTTSSLTHAAIFADMDEVSRNRCFVLHPFTPVWRALPMEVVGADGEGAAENYRNLLQFVTTMGKVPIEVSDRACFAGNVIFCGLMNYACQLVDAGIATPAQINAVLADVLGGGGVFAVHNFIGPYSNALTMHCVREMRAALGVAFEPSTTLVAKATDGTLWDLPTDVVVSDELRVRLRNILLGALFALAYELVTSEVIDPTELDFLTRSAFAWKVGIMELLLQVNRGGGGDYRQMVTAANATLNLPGNEVLYETDSLERFFRRSVWEFNIDLLVEDLEHGVVCLTVYRPDVRNALRQKTLIELEAALRDIEEDNAVKGVVLTGFGGTLAGADVNEIAACKTPREFTDFPLLGQGVTTTIESFSKPVVAVINGHCLGGGAEMAMACRERFMGPHAVVGQPEVKLGIIPGYGGTQRLPRLVGINTAMDWLRTGRLVKANEAAGASWGVLCNDPMAEALKRMSLNRWVNKVMHVDNSNPMAEAPPVTELLPLDVAALGLSTAIDRILCKTVLRGAKRSLDEGLVIEANAMDAVARTADCREGLNAFLAKRPPVWKHA